MYEVHALKNSVTFSKRMRYTLQDENGSKIYFNEFYFTKKRKLKNLIYFLNE